MTNRRIAKFIRARAAYHEARGNFCRAAEFLAMAERFELLEV
jgi:hypothetical protein